MESVMKTLRLFMVLPLLMMARLFLPGRYLGSDEGWGSSAASHQSRRQRCLPSVFA